MTQDDVIGATIPGPKLEVPAEAPTPEGHVLLPLDEPEVRAAVVRTWRRIGISEASIEAQLACLGGGARAP